MGAKVIDASDFCFLLFCRLFMRQEPVQLDLKSMRPQSPDYLLSRLSVLYAEVYA